MNRIDFNKYNRILGISTGILSFVVFALTVEPTASYWDCAEYISTSAKLQIGHPPGAPLFQMLGAIFSIFALDYEEDRHFDNRSWNYQTISRIRHASQNRSAANENGNSKDINTK